MTYVFPKLAKVAGKILKAADQLDFKRAKEPDVDLPNGPKKPKPNATQHFKSFDNARNAALKWLEERGFKAEKPNLAKMKPDPNYGKAIGMTDATGKIGFRIEFGLVDGTMAPHINVFDVLQPKGGQAGYQFVFP